MIDTIVLTLEHPHFKIMEHRRFSPTTEFLYKSRHKLSCTQNPTKKDYADGNYKPRLTVSKYPKPQGFIIKLRIEFSAPKLMYGNNFEEISDEDFGALLKTLKKKLSGMGVAVSLPVLENAMVSTIHFGKNILLLDYIRCSMVLAELKKLNLWPRLDVNLRDYRNGGQVLKWHSNSYEIALYDKLKDLRQAQISPKRAVERDPLWQPDFFKRYDLPKQTEVLRIEIRLNTRRSIRDMLKRLDIQAPLTFSGLCKRRVAKAVILHHWETIMAEHGMAGLLEINASAPDRLAESIICMKPRIKPAKVMQTIGTLTLFQQVGVPGIKAILAGTQKRVIQNLLTQCRNNTPKTQARWTAIRQVARQLQEFHPINSQFYDKVAKK